MPYDTTEFDKIILHIKETIISIESKFKILEDKREGKNEYFKNNNTQEVSVS